MMAPGIRLTGGLALAAAMATMPWLASGYAVDVLTKIMIFAVLAISMELLLGTTGLVSFGQAAFFGVGAYAVVLLQTHFGVTNVFGALMAAIVAAVAVGAVVGALSLRTRHIYFIMVTLAFAQMLYHLAHDTPLVGGSDGMYMMAPLQLSLGPWHGFDLYGETVVYLMALVGLVLSWTTARLLLRAKFGRALRGIGSNEQRMAAMGYVPYRYKLAIFMVGAALAGLAGFLFIAKNGSASPEMMAWHQSGIVLLMVLIGGIGRLSGAVWGAVIYVLLQELLTSHDLLGPLSEYWLLWFGIAIIVIVALLPHGVMGEAERWLKADNKEG